MFSYVFVSVFRKSIQSFCAQPYFRSRSALLYYLSAYSVTLLRYSIAGQYGSGALFRYNEVYLAVFSPLQPHFDTYVSCNRPLQTDLIHCYAAMHDNYAAMTVAAQLRTVAAQQRSVATQQRAIAACIWLAAQQQRLLSHCN